MPLLTACYLAIALVVMLLLTDRARLHPFVALVLLTAAFGFAIRMSLSQIGSLFGIGFTVTLQALGLVIVAASLMSVIAEQSGGADRLAAIAPRRGHLARIVTVIGTLAGIASTPGAALAALTPLVRGLGRNRVDGGNRLTIFLSLAISAGHGLLLPAPVMIAGMAIMGATVRPLLLIGIPLALVTAAVGAIFATLMLRQFPSANLAAGHRWQAAAPVPSGPTAGRVGAMLVVASLVLVVLLAIQSLGDIPSEPLGGGPARAMLLGLGRPFLLLIVGPGLMLLALNRWSRDIISAEGWLGRGLVQAAPTLLLVGAAGGFQRVLQETGMSELLAEKLLTWHIGLLLPFVVAAVLKTLQGSSLVAAITAAGMIQPLLVSLGLDDDTGRALAVLAMGIGSMTVSHINDAFFWLVGENARLRPSHTVAIVTFSMVVQAIIAILLLQFIAMLR
jgi:GntP family gluconate:H+ symporter